ncbi:single-stranded DNA-binding protein [Phycicoccus endophyticus]|uniref:Single-stranded DNA-binding protein n=1 Tax=Phycicoccus endophyticus TaxID=1690220 RepID=A0A7G9R3C5_9MICO|nr:single-stranded DNA-binding protein [Phycicoccus endophyticus]NHI19850.1 single-stranded DNA-binding protein [Phycicoccus endophyticus]QNN50100.1 single-stranded DNA-binding protein [Phycicoccus endophyticus]GGL28029.1 hypothetical protein GCM10012283_07860 [Phycicoccus endophyticus]
MYETYVTVQGRLVADPVVKDGRHGRFTTFRVAQSERHPDRADPGRWTDSPPSFYDVSAFRAVGENAARSLRKGQPVVVHGRLRVRQFQRGDGSPGTAVELDAAALGHDLRWGCTSYVRNGDLAPAPPAQAPADPPQPAGDPATDRYVVDDPGGEGPPAPDTGPLVPPGRGQAA